MKRKYQLISREYAIESTQSYSVPQGARWFLKDLIDQLTAIELVRKSKEQCPSCRL